MDELVSHASATRSAITLGPLQPDSAARASCSSSTTTMNTQENNADVQINNLLDPSTFVYPELSSSTIVKIEFCDRVRGA